MDYPDERRGRTAATPCWRVIDMPDRCRLCNATITGAVEPTETGLLFYNCPTCGRYFMSGTAEALLGNLSDDDRLRLTFAARQAFESRAPLKILGDDITALIAGAPRPASLMDGVDRLLLLLGKRATSFLAKIAINKDQDYPLLFARGAKGMNEMQVVAMQLEYMENNPAEIRLTVNGWRRIEELRASQPDSRQAFVAMWFDHTLDDAWLHGFKKGVERSNYFKAVRVDSIQHNEKIDDRIVAEIRRSGVLVADFTGDRGGVYFEAGLAAGLGIPVIWTCQDDWKKKLHFDTRQYNHIIWTTPADLADQLHERISATVLPRDWNR